jgi:hypothetical protein
MFLKNYDLKNTAHIRYKEMSVMTVLSKHWDNDEAELAEMADIFIDHWNTCYKVCIVQHLPDGDISDEDLADLRVVEHELYMSLTRTSGIVKIFAKYLDSGYFEIANEVSDSCWQEIANRVVDSCWQDYGVNLEDHIDEESYLSNTKTWKEIEEEIHDYLKRLVFKRMHETVAV